MSGIGLVEMTEHECYVHLAAAHLGRVAVSPGGRPMVFPVHFSLLDRNPVFRTEPGTKLTAAAAGNVLCLEIDEVDPVNHTGWSVMVIGPAEILTDRAELARAVRLPLRPWVGDGDAYVRVRAVAVTGRRLEHRTRPNPAERQSRAGERGASR